MMEMVVYGVAVDGIEPTYYVSKKQAIQEARAMAKHTHRDSVIEVTREAIDGTVKRRALHCLLLNGIGWRTSSELVERLQGEFVDE